MLVFWEFAHKMGQWSYLPWDTNLARACPHPVVSFGDPSAMLSFSKITPFSNGSGKDDSRRRLRPKPTPLPHGQRKHPIQLDQTAERSPAGKGTLFKHCGRNWETFTKREFRRRNACNTTPASSPSSRSTRTTFTTRGGSTSSTYRHGGLIQQWPDQSWYVVVSI